MDSIKKPHTPFPTTAYYGPAYFCDREEELKTLINNVKGGNSTTLIAIRRLGKTALIKHLFHKIQKKNITIYLDILSTESLNDLLNQLTMAIGSEIPENTALGKKIWNFIRSLRPQISYDSLQGTPIISISASPETSRKSIHDMFSILEKQSRPVVVAIDEFQQILAYSEKQTDAWFRSMVQQLRNVCFIFSGSQQHLMNELFSNPSRPFFRSTQFLKLEKLDQETYRNFIIQKFLEHKKVVSPEVVDEMLHWTILHTYFVQLLCNRVFLNTRSSVKSEHWKEEAEKILKEQEFVFFAYREMLTKPQWNLLKAIAKEGEVFQPTSHNFINHHNLGNPATVLRSLESLQKNELIHRESDNEGNSFYSVYDILFRRWIDR